MSTAYTPGVSVTDRDAAGVEIGRVAIGRVVPDGDDFRVYNLAGREVGIAGTYHGGVKALLLHMRLPRSRRVVLTSLD